MELFHHLERLELKEFFEGKSLVSFFFAATSVLALLRHIDILNAVGRSSRLYMIFRIDLGRKTDGSKLAYGQMIDITTESSSRRLSRYSSVDFEFDVWRSKFSFYDNLMRNLIFLSFSHRIIKASRFHLSLATPHRTAIHLALYA